MNLPHLLRIQFVQSALIVICLLSCFSSSVFADENPFELDIDKVEIERIIEDLRANSPPVEPKYSPEARAALEEHSRVNSKLLQEYRNLVRKAKGNSPASDVTFAIRMLTKVPTVKNILPLAYQIDYGRPGGHGTFTTIAAEGGRIEMSYPCAQALCRMGEQAVTTLVDYVVSAKEISDKQIELLAYTVLDIREQGIRERIRIDKDERTRLLNDEKKRLQQLLVIAAERSTLDETEVSSRVDLMKHFLNEIDLELYQAFNPKAIRERGIKPPARSVLFATAKDDK